MSKGQFVAISPRAYPNQKWEGEILRKTKYGFSVKYNLNGMWLKEVFSERELKLI